MKTPGDTPEPFEDDPTSQDRSVLPESSGPVPANERNTGTYAGSPEFVAGREAGYETGFKAGVDNAIAALHVELTRAGATKEEIARVVARIRSVATSGH